MFTRVAQLLKLHLRPVSYLLGTIIVTVWTLLRFFTQRTIFDTVSQQVIVHQWLHGTISAAHLGMTAYVPKMLLLYVPVDLLPGSPRLKLILLTIVVNIVTFILLGLVLERLLREFNQPVDRRFYVALIWLSVIAGSVFWVNFVNSRNLEVVGGMFWLYGGLQLLRRPRWRGILGLALFGSLLFFDDPLQFYMSALPLLLYGLVVCSRRRLWRPLGWLVGITLISYIGSRLLFSGVSHWLHLSFTGAGAGAPARLSVARLGQSVRGLVRAILSLFAGAANAGRLREVANLVFWLGAVALFIYASCKHYLSRRLVLLVGCMVVIDSLAYIVSGNAVQGSATMRYLIMLAPVAVLAFGAWRGSRQSQVYVGIFTMVILGLNAVTLGTVLAHNWNTSFPKDAHLASVYRYTHSHPQLNLYASIDTAMPILYLYNLPATDILPLGCLEGLLVQTYYSMDTAFTAAAKQPTRLAAIVLDGSSITNTPNVCTVGSIYNQLGRPQRIDKTDDGSVVLVYRQAAIKFSN